MTQDRELAACPLLPCPFCGSAAEIRGEHYTAIRCPNDQCIISTRDPVPFNFYGHRADAIAAWNRRTPADPPSGELAEVLALLEKATPGPWASVAHGNYGNGEEGSVDGACGADVEPAVAPPYDAPTIRGEVMLADAEAIAAAVNFLRKHGPALLSRTPAGEDARDAAWRAEVDRFVGPAALAYLRQQFDAAMAKERAKP